MLYQESRFQLLFALPSVVDHCCPDPLPFDFCWTQYHAHFRTQYQAKIFKLNRYADHVTAATNLAFEASLSPPYSPPPEMKVQIGPVIVNGSNRNIVHQTPPPPNPASVLAVQDLAKVKIPIPKVTKPGAKIFYHIHKPKIFACN